MDKPWFCKNNTAFGYAEIDHTGTYRWKPLSESVIEFCPLFSLAWTYELEGRRIRRFHLLTSTN